MSRMHGVIATDVFVFLKGAFHSKLMDECDINIRHDSVKILLVHFPKKYEHI